MNLQFTHVPFFVSRSGLRKSRADFSTVSLYCVTITWQQICKGSLYILRWQAFCCMRLLNADILAGNTARQWLPDSVKLHTFILCEKKHEWVYTSNASISLKNPLLRVCDHCAWVSNCTYAGFFSCNIKLRGLLSRIHLCRLVGIRLNRQGWVNTKCKAIFAVASFHNSSGQFCKACVVF